MLDSLSEELGPDTASAPFVLLRTKARDKAYLHHTSDSAMRMAVAYYEKEGSPEKKLEAFYYMGSVARDLHNSPEAVRWYRRAADYGEAHLADVDTNTLACVYAQLADVFQHQGNFSGVLECAKCSYRMERRNADHHIATHELASAYKRLYNYDSLQTAYRDSAYHLFTENLRLYQNRKAAPDYGMIGESLGFYSENGFTLDAAASLALLHGIPVDSLPPTALVNMGYYYLSRSMTDSTEYYWHMAYEKSPDISFRNDACLHLSRLFRQKGDLSRAAAFAEEYMETRDTIETALMREQTANSNNEYIYQRNHDREIAAEKKRLMTERALYALFCLFLLLLIVIAVVVYLARERIRRGHVELEKARNEFGVYVAQRKSLDVSASDIVDIFRKYAAQDISPKSEEEWKALYRMVDSNYPDFFQRVLTRLPNIKDKDKNLLYMLRAGLSKSEIARLTEVKLPAVSNRLSRLEKHIGVSWGEI
ncbi:MAG: hypothetical protein IJ659_06410 [Alloprevotella sp.]|nr:hypothetical protein [Alloprevotella sp.]